MSFTPCDCKELHVVSSVDTKVGATRQHLKDADGVWCCTVVPGASTHQVYKHTLLTPSATAKTRAEEERLHCEAETAKEHSREEKVEQLRSKRKRKESLTEADMELLCDIVLGE